MIPLLVEIDINHRKREGGGRVSACFTLKFREIYSREQTRIRGEIFA